MKYFLKECWDFLISIIVIIICCILLSPIAITMIVWWFVFRNKNARKKFNDIAMALFDSFVGDDINEPNPPFFKV